MTEWTKYRRSNLAEMRPYVPGESLEGISISNPDALTRVHEPDVFNRGMIARNPANHADQWYVASAYFDANFEPIGD
jgi:hypothetical protein